MLVGILLIGLVAAIYQQSVTHPEPGSMPSSQQQAQVITLSAIKSTPSYINYDPLSGQYVTSDTPMIPTTKTVVIGHRESSSSDVLVSNAVANAAAIEAGSPNGNSMSAGAMSECSHLGSYTLSFSHDSTVIHDKAGIDGFLEQAKRCGISRFAVTGFASPDGQLGYNINLAKRRAEAVKNYAEKLDSTRKVYVNNPLKDELEIKARQAEIKISR
jgi:hypothetical protein